MNAPGFASCIAAMQKNAAIAKEMPYSGRAKSFSNPRYAQ